MLMLSNRGKDSEGISAAFLPQVPKRKFQASKAHILEVSGSQGNPSTGASDRPKSTGGALSERNQPAFFFPLIVFPF